jgi:hypothetical protein
MIPTEHSYDERISPLGSLSISENLQFRSEGRGGRAQNAWTRPCQRSVSPRAILGEPDRLIGTCLGCGHGPASLA